MWNWARSWKRSRVASKTFRLTCNISSGLADLRISCQMVYKQACGTFMNTSINALALNSLIEVDLTEKSWESAWTVFSGRRRKEAECTTTWTLWKETWLLSDRGWGSAGDPPPPLNPPPQWKHSSRALIVPHKVPQSEKWSVFICWVISLPYLKTFKL